MARITIEDCIEQIPNRFKLVQMAAIRAKQLKRGAVAYVEKENKEVVTALREIAAGIVKPDELAEPVIPATNEGLEAISTDGAESGVEASDLVEEAPAAPEEPTEAPA